MAGAGYKLFNTGDVLTAAQVNTYLQEQAVMRFANSTARTTALSGVLAEGMMSYLDDTNSVEVYNGSAWVSVGSTGDITGVTAGTGISGGGTSGDVTITNSMATAIDAKGDLIVGTGADTFSRLAVGATNGHTLQVDSSTATGLKWAATSAGGFTELASGSLTGTTVSLTSISSSYIDLVLYVRDFRPATDGARLFYKINTGGVVLDWMDNWSLTNRSYGNGDGALSNASGADNTVSDGFSLLRWFDYANTSTMKLGWSMTIDTNATTTTNYNYQQYWHSFQGPGAINRIDLYCSSGNFAGGTYVLYGVK